jgi:hypothetical protein
VRKRFTKRFAQLSRAPPPLPQAPGRWRQPLHPAAAPRPATYLPRAPRSKLYEIKSNGMSPLQNMLAYLGGSAIQTVGDNPVTA